MLTKRVIGVVTMLGGRAVQSLGFSEYRPIGSPVIAAEYLNRWGADEICLIDISASRGSTPIDFDLIRAVGDTTRVPFSYGGGIRNLEDLSRAIRSGADKVLLNRALLVNPELLSRGAARFGDQAIVAGIDGVDSAGTYFVRGDHSGRTVEQLVEVAVALGAGEIFLTAVQRDGAKQGFDLPLLKQISEACSIPVIGCGGAGAPAHFVRAFTESKCSALAAGNMFSFCEHSVRLVKRALVEAGLPVRIDREISYLTHALDEDGRVARLSDEQLLSLRFQHVEEEAI